MSCSLAALALLTALGLGGSASEVLAQGQILGEIRGTVKDQQGGVLPGVLVTATPSDNRPPLTTTTNAAGFYSITDVLPGDYTLKAELASFATLIQPGIQARAGMSISADVVMTIGTVGETITVTRESPLLESKSATTGINVTGELQRSLPLSGARDWSNAVLLAPGIISNESSDSLQYSLHGGNPSSNVLQVDGADMAAGTLATNRYVHLSTSAINDVQIKTGALDASTPLGLGIVVNLTTPSGTNRLAGDIGANFQPQRWNADNTTGGTSASVGLFQADMAIGGPILRDRWWFFGAYRRTQQSTGLTRSATQLAALRALSTSFVPFDNEVNANATFVKSTSQLSTNHQLMVFAQRDVTPQDSNDGTYAARFLRQVPGGSAYATRLSSVWRSTTTSKVQISYNDKSEPFVVVAPQDRPGRRVYQSTLLSSGQLIGNGLLAVLDSYPNPSVPDVAHKLTVAADVTHLRQGWFGSHEIQSGIYIQPSGYRRTSQAFGNNGFVVEDVVLANPADPAGGVAPFHRRIYATPSSPVTFIDSSDYAFYAQDVWRPFARLTLTAGARVDKIRQTDRVFDLPVQDSTEIGPRFGINYLMTEDGRNVARASWTRVHDTVQSTAVSAGTSSGGLSDLYDLNLDGTFETTFTTPPSTRLNPNRVFDIDNWHQPYVNEWTIGYRRQFPGLITVDAGWIQREFRDRAAGIEINGIYEGGVFRGYRNPEQNQIYLVANNTWNWPVYSAFELQATKQTARLQAIASYTRQWRHLAGTWQPNDPASFIQPDAFPNDKGIGQTRGNPGTAADADSLSGAQGIATGISAWHDHAFRAGGSYRAPLGLLLAATYIFQSGAWSGPVVTRLPAPDPSFGPSTITLSNGRVASNPLATTTRFAGPTRSDGQVALPALHVLNVRIGREVRFGHRRLTAALDVFNATNHDADQAFLSGGNQLYSPTYGLGTTRQLPRAAQLTLSFVF